MVEEEMAHFDFQDADTEEFFRKGLQDMYEDWDAARLTNALMQYGSYLIYREEFSNRDAAMLRRLFSARPPVRILYISEISHGAFRTAFDGQGECPSLRKIHFDRIDCEGQDLGIDRCEVLKNVHSLDLGSVNVGRGFAQEVASYIRQNESLEELWLHVSCSPDQDIGPIIESLKVHEINVLLQRNVLLKNRAAQFVTTGADINDEEGVDALRKVQASSCLVEEVQELTGKTSELALQEIRAALARSPM
ncbi:hypothetical protein HPB51_010960 [Rhipicephalus microplus]|uniref:Uncharacterized protein n=1 Tax=Rhipicephalus microplus TaxID=6941 RepID=A0A9J6E8W7_RHIMP|nr:hypothetical protein HPB51_010960 [Rhipicephalus microplus]